MTTDKASRRRSFARVPAKAEHSTLDDQIRQWTLFDPLTGLPNRTLFLDRLRHACSRKVCNPHPLAVLFLDLDGFKFVNGSHGHAVADQLLMAVARRLSRSLCADHLAARYGGDGFAILLEQVTGRDQAVQVAERIMRDLQRPFLLDGRTRFITAGAGIALGLPSRDDTQPERLIRHAEIALHQAKRTGNASVSVFEPGMARLAVERLDLETDLHLALERDEFQLHYQPIIGLESGSIVGVEALVRWHHPDRGVVSPMEFIPVAEETGLIVPLGRWVLEEACRQAVLWEVAAPNQPVPTMSVNLSAIELHQPGYVEYVERVLDMTGLDPTRLELEITEGAAMKDAEATVARLRALKDLGTHLSIDDFGTGYSSLSYLRHFPIDTLKVDQSFVSAVGDDAASDTIIDGLVALAHGLGLGVVAEGIENPEQLKRLRTIACDFGQGYYFSQPLPGDELQAFCQAGLQLSMTA